MSQTHPFCYACGTDAKMVLHGNKWVCHGTHVIGEPDAPECPKCGSAAQVWENQITHRLTCHRVGCHENGGLE